MATKTLVTPAIYTRGMVKPLQRPDFEVAETLVTFVPVSTVRNEEADEDEKDKEKRIREVLDKTFGILPNLPPGVVYENRIRKSWERRLKRLWQPRT